LRKFFDPQIVAGHGKFRSVKQFEGKYVKISCVADGKAVLYYALKTPPECPQMMTDDDG
jgi:hypothetical protein